MFQAHLFFQPYFIPHTEVLMMFLQPQFTPQKEGHNNGDHDYWHVTQVTHHFNTPCSLTLFPCTECLTNFKLPSFIFRHIIAAPHLPHMHTPFYYTDQLKTKTYAYVTTYQ